MAAFYISYSHTNRQRLKEMNFQVLAMFKQYAEEKIPQIISYLASDSPEVRQTAQKALERLEQTCKPKFGLTLS